MPTLHQDASESVEFMLLAVETVTAKEVEVSMTEVAAEDVEEDVNEVEQDTSKEVVEGAAAHMRMCWGNMVSHSMRSRWLSIY